jgi:hypothetical protein
VKNKKAAGGTLALILAATTAFAAWGVAKKIDGGAKMLKEPLNIATNGGRVMLEGYDEADLPIITFVEPAPGGATDVEIPGYDRVITMVSNEFEDLPKISVARLIPKTSRGYAKIPAGLDFVRPSPKDIIAKIFGGRIR